MKRPSLLACLLLCASGMTLAAEPMNIVGLPLGAKLKMPIRQCGPDELDADVKTLCWVRMPVLFNTGTRSGTLNVPGAGQRPKWAAQKTMHAAVERDGTLSAFTIHTARADAFADIRNAIASDLGRPRQESRPGAAKPAAVWNWKDAHVELACAPDTGCETAFSLAGRSLNVSQAYDLRYNTDPIQPASPKTR